MIERVKAAIWNSLHDSLSEEQRAAIDFHNLTFDHAARAAIEAMREPTEEMCWSATDVSVGTGCEGTFTIHLEAAKEAWQAMIDAALKEGQ